MLKNLSEEIVNVTFNCEVVQHLNSSTFTPYQNFKEFRSESSPGMITGTY